MLEIINSSAFWVGLGQIIIANLLLSGDNAVVIALASRSLPPKQQKQAIFWGSAAAIFLRVILTIFAVQLLQYPWLKLIGGLLLIYIGVQLLDQADDDHSVKEAGGLMDAVRTILIADLVMSLDNVIAVAAAAQTAPEPARIPLLIVGLAMSIPIVIFGSQLVLKLMDRWPIIITLGAMLLGWLAGDMIYSDQGINAALPQGEVWHYAFKVIGALVVWAIGWLINKRQHDAESKAK